MDIALSDVTNTGGTATTTNAKGASGMSGSDFLDLLIKQLQYQDPLEPMSNEEMLSQISTIRELELTTQLSQRLETLSEQQRFASVTSMIGKHVTGEVADEAGNAFPVEGVVEAIRFTSEGKIMLELDSGEDLPLTGLESVTDLEPEVDDEHEQPAEDKSAA